MRYAMGLEYDGSAFFGWQVQAEEPTIQGSVEDALTRVADEKIQVVCCGRTDTGVHALCQVVHFETGVERSERQWILGVNRYVPPGISVLWLRTVDEDFHARFSAVSRTYRYHILNRWVRPALDIQRRSWCRKPLDAELMQEAAQLLLGKHDFSSFRAAHCQAQHAVREIQQIDVQRKGNEVQLEVSANGFLYHMVRNIAGSLIAVGLGDRPVDWLGDVLEKCDRKLAAATAAPHGLYFVGARYPEQFQLPSGAIDFPVFGVAE
jgi:tRNA pseudouridine38-40 synthase